MVKIARAWRKKAFSLIEIMFTVAVFTIVSMSVIGVLDASLRETYRLTQANDPFRDVQVYVEQIRVRPLSEFSDLQGKIDLFNKDGDLQTFPLNSWITIKRAKDEVPVQMRINIKFLPEKPGKPPSEKGDPPLGTKEAPQIEIIVKYKWTPEYSAGGRVSPTEKQESIRILRSYVVRY